MLKRTTYPSGRAAARKVNACSSETPGNTRPAAIREEPRRAPRQQGEGDDEEATDRHQNQACDRRGAQRMGVGADRDVAGSLTGTKGAR